MSSPGEAPFRYNDIAYKDFETWFENYGLQLVDAQGGEASSFFTGRSPWVDADAFIQAGDAGDDALSVQRAIDHAQNFLSSNTGVPDVRLTPRANRWRTPITLKSARLVASWPNVTCRVLWDGSAGATVMTKTSAYPGSMSFGGIEGVNFRPGTATPGTWLDITASDVDVMFRLREIHFAGSTSDTIKMGGWVNCHWEHLRFDEVGGYAIRSTPFAGQALSTFVLDKFTYDHARASGPGSGFFMLDNSNNNSNLGVLAFRNGRIEVNTAWTGNKAVVNYKLPDVGASPRAFGINFDNVTYQDVAGMASDVLLYHETALTNTFPSLTLSNFRQQGLSAIVGGGLSSSWPAIPLQSLYGFLSVAQGGNEVMASQVRFLGAGAVATNATTGFAYLPTCAGTPTGTPASVPAGTVPAIYDTTGNKLWIYDGGWIGVAVS